MRHSEIRASGEPGTVQVNAYAEILRSAKTFNDLAEQVAFSNRAFREIEESLQRQFDLFASVVTPDVMASIETTRVLDAWVANDQLSVARTSIAIDYRGRRER